MCFVPLGGHNCIKFTKCRVRCIFLSSIANNEVDYTLNEYPIMATVQQSHKKCHVFRPQSFHSDCSKPSPMQTTLMMYIIKYQKH